MKPLVFDHIWFWLSRLPQRKGQPCRVLVRGGTMNSVLVQFEDGQKVVTSRYAVRKDAALFVQPAREGVR